MNKPPLVVGIVVSCLVLGIGLTIALAPYGPLQNPAPPPVWHNVPDRPYVPPPACPGTLSFGAGTIERLSGNGDRHPTRCMRLRPGTLHPGASPPFRTATEKFKMSGRWWPGCFVIKTVS